MIELCQNFSDGMKWFEFIVVLLYICFSLKNPFKSDIQQDININTYEHESTLKTSSSSKS